MSHALTFACAAVWFHLLLGGSGPGPWRWVALPFTVAGATAFAMAAPVVLGVTLVHLAGSRMGQRV